MIPSDARSDVSINVLKIDMDYIVLRYATQCRAVLGSVYRLLETSSTLLIGPRNDIIKK